MNSPTTEAEALQLEMQNIRMCLGAEVHGLVENARSMTDWRQYWRTHPLLWCGAARAAGYLIVPSKRPEKSPVQDLAGAAPAAAAPPSSSIGRKLVAELTGMGLGFVAQRGMLLLGNYLDAFLTSRSGAPKGAASEQETQRTATDGPGPQPRNHPGPQPANHPGRSPGTTRGRGKTKRRRGHDQSN